MSVFPCLALLALRQDLKATHGRTDAQILAMGRKRWHDFYVEGNRGVTAVESGAESSYGDALARRNDRLLGGRPFPLRAALRAFRRDAVDAGSALTGGGTIWIATGATLYGDAEEALYAVLTHSGHAPSRRVSDVERAVARLRHDVSGIDRAEDRRRGLAAIGRLEVDTKTVAALAAHLPRRDSDTVLEFCRSTVLGMRERDL